MRFSTPRPGRAPVHWRALFAAALCIPLGFLLTGCERGPRYDRPVPEYRAEVINPDLAAGMILPDSGTLLAWGGDGTVMRSSDGLKWSHAHTPVAADLVVGAAQGKTALIVGERGSLIRSDDDGMTWSAAGKLPDDARLQAVAYDAKRGVWVVAGTAGTIARSTDDGKTWLVQRSDKPIKLDSLYYDADTETLWLGGENGLLGHSTDGGENWTLLQLPMDTPIAGFHRFGNALVARSGLGRLLVSHKGSGDWQLFQLKTKGFFTDAAVDPVSASIVVTDHLGEVARSTDGGRSWNLIQTSFGGRHNYLSAVRFDEKARNLIAVGHHGTMLRSVDGGVRWEEALPPGIPVSFSGLIYAPGRLSMAVTGKGGYLLGSADGGEVWQTAAVSLREYQREILYGTDGQVAVTAGDVGSIYRGNGAGHDWLTPDIVYPNPATPPAYRALEMAPSGQAMLAAGPPGTIMRSTDAGETWTVQYDVPLEKGEATVQLLIDAPRKTVIALDAFGTHKRSIDDGLSWQEERADPAGKEIWHGALAADGAVVAVGKGGLIQRGAPGGKGWKTIVSGVDLDLYGSHCQTDGKRCFALGQKGHVLGSDDAGQSWRILHQGGDAALRRIVVDPRGEALVAYGERGLILRSTDQGRTWTRAASGVEAELRAAAIEPGTGRIVLAGAAGTILRSPDGGQTWERLPSHTLRHFRGLRFNPADGTLLLVGERSVRLVPNTPVQPR